MSIAKKPSITTLSQIIPAKTAREPTTERKTLLRALEGNDLQKNASFINCLINKLTWGYFVTRMFLGSVALNF